MTTAIHWQEMYFPLREICQDCVEERMWEKCNRQIWQPSCDAVMLPLVISIEGELLK